MKRLFSFILSSALLVIPTFTQAQEPLIHGFNISLSKGFTEILVPRKAHSSEIDFMNYVYNYPLELSDSYTAISLGLKIDSKVELNYKMLMQYTLNFKNINTSIKYNIDNVHGINVGFYRYEQILNRFYDFSYAPEGEHFYLLADLRAKERFFDNTYYAGYFLRMNFSDIKCIANLNGGLCSFNPFEIDLFLKRVNSNDVIKQKYVNRMQWDAFLFPEINFKYDLTYEKKVDMGIEFNANSILSYRSIPYIKTVYTNLTVNQESALFKPDRHLYFRYEFGLGVYLEW